MQPRSTRTHTLFPDTTLFRCNIVILRPLDEIGDDQEIAGKAHLDDDPDCEVEPREIGLALRLGERLARKRLDLGEPHLEPGARILAQLGRLTLAIARETRQDRLALWRRHRAALRSEEHTSELQSLMRISYAVFCLKQNTHNYKFITAINNMFT